jgi:hypothetical protein
MAQFTIAYVALGIGVLLVLAGVLAVTQRSSRAMLTAHQRRLMVGGVGGMLAFIVALVLWLRSSLWMP